MARHGLRTLTAPGIVTGLLYALLSAGACTEDPTLVGTQNQAIINGQSCAPDELPETVALLIDATLNFGGDSFPLRTLLCTGTLIAPDTVMTAAHCVDESGLTGGFGTVESATYYVSRQADLRDLIGDGDTLAALPSDAMAVRSVVKQESFTLDVAEAPRGLGNFYDIGLVFLEEPVANLEPAIVMTPSEAQGLGVGIDVQISGWGQQSPDPEGPIGTRHCADAKIFEISEFEMQIGNEPSTARKCHGDSGGPTMIRISTDSRRKERVIGITSRAYDESDCGKGGVDTLASSWYQWIDDKMSERCQAGQRAWCEVPGVIPPEYYDDGEGMTGGSEQGGCNSGGPASGGAAILLFLVIAWHRRQFAQDTMHS
jgi:hypothetical protein